MNQKYHTVKTEAELTAFLSAHQYVLIDFFATWCGPCQMLAGVLDQMLAANSLGEVQVLKVDTDLVPEAAQKYGVLALPTVVLAHNGQEVGRFSGFRPESAIQALIQTHFFNEKK